MHLSLSRQRVAGQYRRSRYYDPSTTRFTQEDPIRLAGGLSAYGHAAGDQVIFRSPAPIEIPEIDRGIDPEITPEIIPFS